MDKKISILGLDNAGKTSILYFLDRKFNLIRKLKPTTKAKVNLKKLDLLGLNLNMWDFGGQTNYRKQYLEDKERYFSNISSCFFVIDIQDKKRAQIALSYMQNLSKLIKNFNPDLNDLVVLLHKYDPELHEEKDYVKYIENLKQQIRDLSLNFNISFYTTSIYEGSNILKAFSEEVIRKTGKGQLLENVLKDYTKKTFSSAALLLSESYLFLAKRATKERYLNFCTDIVPELSRVMDRLNKWDIKTDDSILNVQIPDGKSEKPKKGVIFMKRIDIEYYGCVYLMTLCLNKKIQERAYKNIPKLAQKIKTIID
ncbi:MAG: GTP-binding protein [Promethearchaeota archaeon]|nr:MAG: GTP-binding protein [Candidatus Lokiarchaeota archaeon]